MRLGTKSTASPWPFLLVGLVVTLPILVWGLLRSPQNAFDDAFITYRYADNLRRGIGLVYNPGEWVLGTTAPLYALLLGGLSSVGGTIEWWGHWTSVVGWFISAWAAMGQLWLGERRAAGVLAALFIALTPLMVPVLGMETGVLLALLWLSSWAWMRDRRVLAPVLSALAILTRQDAALFVLLLLLATALRRKRVPWREGLLTAALVLPWFAYAFWRYGTLLPNSALAKVNQNVLMVVGGSKSFIEQFLAYLTDSSPLAALAVGAALLVGLYVIFRSVRQWWWLPVWVAGYLAVYVIMNVHSFPWYFAPPLTGCLVVCALGLGALLGDGLAADGRRMRWPRAIAVLCAVVIAAIYGRSAFAAGVQTQPGYLPEYRDVASWLATSTERTDRVATIEIGVIGFLSERPILDTMGLVSAEMKGHLVGWVETLVYAVSQYSPEYVVALTGTGWDTVTPEWWFLDRYEQVATYGRATIYRRHPSATKMSYRVDERADFANGFAITGLEASTRDLAPGQPVTGTLNVAVARNPGRDCLMVAYLADSVTYERVAVREERPYGGGYGCASWQAGDVLGIPVRITAPQEMPPGAYRIGVEFIEPATGEYFPLASNPAAQSVELGWLRAGNPVQAQVDGARTQTSVQWENGIRLLTVAVGKPGPAHGGVPPIAFRWQADATPTQDLTFFVHLVDAESNIVAQSDRRPFGGRFPTTVWRPGEPLEDVFTLESAADLAPGEYSLRVGFYDSAGRLPIAGGGDSFTLQSTLAVPGP